MEDKLRLNNKLFGMDGVIGRRDFIFNSVLAILLPFLVLLILSVFLFILIKIFTYNTQSIKLPVLIGAILIYIPSWLLLFSNCIRRLNDILGKEDKRYHILYAITTFPLICIIPENYLKNIFSNYPYLLIAVVLQLIIATAFFIFLLVKKGKVTSRYPYDFTKEFNWGAFFGSWLWGLYNKSYLPLINLIFGWSPFPIWLFINMIWGLKGNEWAYKNKKWDDVEKFNQAQKKQAVFFIIFSVIGRIILGCIIIACINIFKN